MPVRKMTDEEAERIFGGGFVVFGIKPPKKPEAKSESREDAETEGDGIRAEALRRLKVRRLFE